MEYVNHSMVRIFGISYDSLQTQPGFFLSQVIPEDVDYLLEEYEKLKERSSVEDVECRLKSHDRHIKTISCDGYIVDGRAFCFVRDISRQRENEEYIVNYGAKKDALLDMVTHNLSGPLNVTQSILDSMSKVLQQKENDEIHKHLQLVRESTSHCIDIVNDFLEEEHLTSEHISIKLTRFDVIEKVNNLLERMRSSASSKRYVLTSDASSLFVKGDEVKFMQIVQNLLSNATKFTPDDGLIEVTVRQMAKSYSVSVCDNGIGIPEHLKNLIFEKYTPAGRPGTNGEKSIGMGLYIVNRLVAMLNGKITFESEPGKGSIFTVQFLIE